MPPPAWLAGKVPEVTGVRSDVSWLRIAVTDTGPGVPAALRPRLFEPFTQADSTSTRAHGGSGLGLAIVRQLVERMGGYVTLAPEGPGATFDVDLPLEAVIPPRVLLVEVGAAARLAQQALDPAAVAAALGLAPA